MRRLMWMEYKNWLRFLTRLGDHCDTVSDEEVSMNNRTNTIQELANSYDYFLRTLPFHNETYMKGMAEARTKFIANLHIYLTTRDLPKGYKERRYGTDYVSVKALEVLTSHSTKGLVYEHIVPKTKFIKNECENMARSGDISIGFIYEVLDKYLWTATITNTENKLLPTAKDMPSGWDRTNIFFRYESANIPLVGHDKSYLMTSAGDK